MNPARLFANRERDSAALATGVALGLGLCLMAQAAFRLSATYDEWTYIDIACRWWLTGDQQAITRMGSPLTFWKIQQAPMLWLLDQQGLRSLLERPEANQDELLPLLRIGSLWIWLAAAALAVCWARQRYGLWAGAFAAWLYALGPNLLAHGGLITMEMPLAAAATAAFWAFFQYLETDRPRWLIASAVAGGLAFSCKFTAVLLPVLFVVPLVLRERARAPNRRWSAWSRAGRSMALYCLILIATNLVLTGGATLTLSESTGAHPAIRERLGPHLGAIASDLAERSWPADWVAFATQMRHQSQGGPSYLLGERRNRGWIQYYAVAIAVKLPLAIAGLALMRAASRVRSTRPNTERLLWLLPLGFLAIASAGSTRNYGFRYLLLVAPLVVVWLSGLAASTRPTRLLAAAYVGLLGLSSLGSTPHFVSYFNELAGGSRGGRAWLADSNLDWGQGARELARLQADRPELRDMTIYYFGSTDPGWYGVVGRRIRVDAGENHPDLAPRLEVSTPYLAVSASLEWGPWGPPGYFDALRNQAPLALTPDSTLAIYQTPGWLATPSPNVH